MNCRNCEKECKDYGFGHCKSCCGGDMCICGHTQQCHHNTDPSITECFYQYNCDCKKFVKE